MGDQTTGNPAAGSGQSLSASAAAGAAGGAGEQQQGAVQTFITREEALQLFEQEFGKKGQSIADRTTARVQKVLDAAKQQGVAMTPQQAQAVIDAAGESAQQPQRQQNQATPPSQGQGQAANVQAPNQPPAQPPAQLPAYDPVTTKAITILRDEFGLKDFNPEQVDMEEPEYSLLDMATDDPETFLSSVRAYGKAKAERQGQEGDAARLPSLGNGSPSSTPAHANKPGRSVLEEYYRNHST